MQRKERETSLDVLNNTHYHWVSLKDLFQMSDVRFAEYPGSGLYYLVAKHPLMSFLVNITVGPGSLHVNKFSIY